MRALLATAAVLLAAPAVAPAVASAAAPQPITGPTQPASGPGSSATPFSDVRIYAGGRGAAAWYVFEPVTPKPTTLPLAIVTHGYGEFSGNRMNGAIARHTALMGNVVIYPRWQDNPVSCPGPFYVKSCVDDAAKGIKAALSAIRANPANTQADPSRTSYFGFSFGGIITANLANEWRKRALPEPRAIFLDDPHDGGFTWEKEYALGDSLVGIPPATKVVCHSGADGVTTKSTAYSCGAVFPRLGHIPAANKNLVMTFTDTHGTPELSSEHGVCAGQASGLPFSSGGLTWRVDAYDWNFCWRTFDALRDCAFTGTNCRYSLGDSPENRFLGTWSDGVPVIGLRVQASAPLRRTPVPPREAAP